MLALHPDVNVIVADDGLQHYALGRQIEIQLSDARGHGNGWLLPAGPLREPAWRRSDFYVLNGVETHELHHHTMHLQGAQAERLIDRNERMPLAALHDGRRVAAAAGIGHPQRLARLPDQRDLMRWLSGFRRAPRRVFLVHGEDDGLTGLQTQIHDRLAATAG